MRYAFIHPLIVTAALRQTGSPPAPPDPPPDPLSCPSQLKQIDWTVDGTSKPLVTERGWQPAVTTRMEVGFKDPVRPGETSAD